MPKSLRVQNERRVENERRISTAPPTIKQSGGGVGQTKSVTIGSKVFNAAGLPLVNDLRVSVSAMYGSDGLQVVQFVNASPVPGGFFNAGTPQAVRIQQLFINGQERSAFVDGGNNSPITASPPIGEGAPRVPGKPYQYNSALLSNPQWANATWDNNSGTGEITAFDIPSAVQLHRETKFETYFVLQNYAGSKQDKIVGRLDWGYKMEPSGLQFTGFSFTPADKFSTEASTILSNDYQGAFEYKPIK